MDTKEYLKNMTVADKARLLCGTNYCSFGGFDTSAGPIPEVRMQDGGTGINFEHLMFHPRFASEELLKEYSLEEANHVVHHFYETDTFTEHEKTLQKLLNDELIKYRDGIDCAPGCYPPGILLASTWDPETVYETGKALGMEASVYHIGVLLGTPNVNILRDPVNGRFFEGYSEDPLLAKTLAPEMCRGVEEAGVAANVKHFACNNLEKNRTLINELVSMRALREIYFPAFEACSKVASTLMSAYNSINGKHCHENKWLLNDVLRDEWGFNGVTVTDWGACKERAGDSVACGQDLFMPGPFDPSDIAKAVEEGRLPNEDLDNAALRILELIGKVSDVAKTSGLTTDKYRETGDKAAYNAASEGIVMLKNDNCMPLKKTDKVVFFGPESFRDYGSGSAEVCTDRLQSLSSELKSHLGEDSVLRDDIEAFRQGATAIVIARIDSCEGSDRADLRPAPETVETIGRITKESNHGKICLILNVPGPVELSGLENAVDAIFTVFYPGMMGARAMADIITGKVNPSGALPCTFPVSYSDTPACLSYPDKLTCLYGEGIYTGYRGYHKRGIKPLYPFGYGLSYSRFDVEGYPASRKDNRISIPCEVTNGSDIDGKAIVQVYVGKASPETPRETVKLAGYRKVPVKAGSKERVEISFDVSELAYFDEEYDKFLIENGKYEIYVSVEGCEGLKRAGDIYIDDGSEELKCGPEWSLGRISKYKTLTDAIRKDCGNLNIPFVAFEANAIYVPSMKLRELFKDAVDNFAEFKNAAGSFREE